MAYTGIPKNLTRVLSLVLQPHITIDYSYYIMFSFLIQVLTIKQIKMVFLLKKQHKHAIINKTLWIDFIMKFINGCITLNRVCNLRCKWCYAKDTGYHTQDTMPLKVAKDIVDLCKGLKFRHLKLIGGEPTLYPYLFDLIAYTNSKQIKAGFLTNGIMLNDRYYTRELINHGIKHISISLKGCNPQSFKNTTGMDAYEKVITGIENCLSLDASVVVFIVLSNENISDLLDCVKSLYRIGVGKFRFTFVYNFDTTPGYKEYIKKTQPRRLIETFKSIYGEIDCITNHQIGIFPTYPACFWGIDFIQMLSSKNQLVRGCTLKDRTDLIFDCQGNLIPCSAMYQIKFGKLYEDFSTSDELSEYCNSNFVTATYDKHYVTPCKKCSTCMYSSLCDCCSCQWTNYSFKQLMLSKK